MRLLLAYLVYSSCDVYQFDNFSVLCCNALTLCLFVALSFTECWNALVRESVLQSCRAAINVLKILTLIICQQTNQR